MAHATGTKAHRLPVDQGEMRTIMAADRTLMAWIRTALSMLSFSFTIYKFLEDVSSGPALSDKDTPQQVGLFLAAMGTISMVLGTLDYWTTLKALNRTEKFRLDRPSLLIAVLLSIAGAALFFGIALRLF